MKYGVEFDPGTGPEDMEDGRCYEIIHVPPWQEGKGWLPVVAKRCTREDAERICRLLSEDSEARTLLRALVSEIGIRGKYLPGGSDFNTEEGRIWRAARHFLNR